MNNTVWVAILLIFAVAALGLYLLRRRGREMSKK